MYILASQEFNEDVEYQSLLAHWRKVDQFEKWLPIWKFVVKRFLHKRFRTKIMNSIKKLEGPTRKKPRISVAIEQGNKNKSSSIRYKFRNITKVWKSTESEGHNVETSEGTIHRVNEAVTAELR